MKKKMVIIMSLLLLFSNTHADILSGTGGFGTQSGRKRSGETYQSISFNTVGKVLSCIIFLPLCLLDEKIGPELMLKRSELDAFLSQGDIESVLDSQEKFLDAINFAEDRLELDENSKVNSAKKINSIVDGLDPIYVDLLLEKLGINE